jgi:eukaryotic-like serine/threonine-protein kinase
MEPYAPANFLIGCPGRGMLIDFDLGKLPAHDVDFIAEHLSSCERCESVLQDLQRQTTEDDLVALLKRCLRIPPLPDELAFGAREATTDKLPATLDSPGNPAGPAVPRRAAGAEIGRMVGLYKVYGKIGQGGMGVVYRAQQVPLKRLVALKMISAGHHATAQAIDRFIREGKAVARLRHPNVVQVYDLGESEGLPYYSMELVEGGNLQSKLDQGPFGLREAADLVRTLAEAVEFAHREGVVHRDLKPANILLTREGTPKITDFGLAKMLDVDSDSLTTAPFTASNLILGTPSYMAPEQAEGGSARIGRSADIYALGAILYALLTGRSPFAGEPKLKILQLVRSTLPPPPSRSRPEIPFWLEAICLKCLEKQPARRYSSARALADDLDRWLRDERPRGTPSWLIRFGRGVRRNGAAILIGLAPISVGAAIYLNQPGRIVEDYQSQLAGGRSVGLVGKTGMPKWHRWQAGGSRSQMVLADDRAFTIHTWTTALLELLPDPGAGSYRLTMQIRHETSDINGEVGLYVGRTDYFNNNKYVNFFTQIIFNDVHPRDELRPRVLESVRHAESVRENSVLLLPRIYEGETGSHFNVVSISGVAGPHFKAMGQNNGRWHDLEVVVTPEGVNALWNGSPFGMTAAAIQQKTNSSVTKFALREPDRLPREFRTVFDSRGGLGLYVRRGSASFRSVTVSPLGASDRISR